MSASQAALTTFQRQASQIDKGELKQLKYLVIDCSAAIDGNGDGFHVDGTGLSVAQSIITTDGNNTITTGANSKVWVRLNHRDNPWLPFSMIASSGHYNAIIATIKKLWVKVLSGETQNAKLVLLVQMAVDVSTNGGAGTSGGFAGNGV